MVEQGRHQQKTLKKLHVNENIRGIFIVIMCANSLVGIVFFRIIFQKLMFHACKCSHRTEHTQMKLTLNMNLHISQKSGLSS